MFDGFRIENGRTVVFIEKKLRKNRTKQVRFRRIAPLHECYGPDKGRQKDKPYDERKTKSIKVDASKSRRHAKEESRCKHF